MKVEMYVVYDDGTWQTEILDYPGPDDIEREDVVLWFERAMMPKTRYRHAILAQLGAYGNDLGPDA